MSCSRVGRWIGRPSCSSSTHSSAAADSECAVRITRAGAEAASACCCSDAASRASGRPRAQPLRGGEPAVADGLGAQVAVRPDGGVGVAGVLGGTADEVEQVTTGVTGQAGGVEPPGVGPGERRVGVPAAPDEAVHLEDVPAAVDPDPGPHQRCCRVSGRPPDPAGVPLGLQGGDTRHDLGARPGRGLPFTDEGAEVAGERHRDLLRAVGGGGHGLHPTSVTTWSRGVARPGRAVRGCGTGRSVAPRPSCSGATMARCRVRPRPTTARPGRRRVAVAAVAFVALRRFAADRRGGGRARLRRRPRCRGALGGHPRGLLRLGGGRALGRQHQPRQPPRRRPRPDGLLRQRRRHRRADQGVPSQPEPGGRHRRGRAQRQLRLLRRAARRPTAPSPGTSSPAWTSPTTGPAGRGRRALLRTFARSHDVKMVVVGIGGNDFDFATVISSCVGDFLTSTAGHPNYCHDDPWVRASFTPAKVAVVKARIATGLRNVRTAMRQAGYADSAWSMVVQNYASPIPPAAGFRYRQTKLARQAIGGCGFWDKDADWANRTALATINSTVRRRGGRLRHRRGEATRPLRGLQRPAAVREGRRAVRGGGAEQLDAARRGGPDRVGQPDPHRHHGGRRRTSCRSRCTRTTGPSSGCAAACARCGTPARPAAAPARSPAPAWSPASRG